MANINPFNGRKDLRVTFYGDENKILAMFKVLAIDLKNNDQLYFLNGYINTKPHENDGFSSFEKEIKQDFMDSGALNCETLYDFIQSKEGEIKSLKCEITRDW